MEVVHELQRHILLKLIHNPKISFTELWDNQDDSNKFAYHLSSMEEKGLIIKKDGKYSLSEAGKTFSCYIEGDTGQPAALPTLCHALVVEKNGKFLTQKRLKEPFYGYWALPSGKTNFGYNVEECARRDLTEEAGLIADHAEIIGMNQIKTFENNKMIMHHILFFVRLTGISGILKSETHKAHNEWLTIEELQKKERLPDPWLTDILHTKSLIFLESERYMENGKFVDIKIKKKTLYPESVQLIK